jgi:hypothetical protein
MKPLVVLLGAFVISLGVIRYVTGTFDYSLAGRIAMSVMLAFTAMGHFAFTKGMTLMLPDFVPFKTEVVYLTGILEIIAAVCRQVQGPLVGGLVRWPKGAGG